MKVKSNDVNMIKLNKKIFKENVEFLERLNHVVSTYQNMTKNCTNKIVNTAVIINTLEASSRFQ